MRRRLLALMLLGACDDASWVNGDVTWEGAGGRVTTSYVAIVPTVTGALNGTQATLLVDTGAYTTLVDVDSFPGVATGDRVELDAFGYTFHDVEVTALDLFPQPPGEVQDGILAGDVLRNFALTLDYHGEQAWLAEAWDPSAIPAGVPVGAEQDVPFDLSGGGRGTVDGRTLIVPQTRVMVKVRFEAQADPVWALVDSGASYVLLEESYFEGLGDAAGRPRLDGIQVTTANGIVDAYLSRVWRAEVGEDVVVGADDVPIFVIPGIGLFDSLGAEVGRDVHALVGGAFLRHYLTTFDYPEETLRFLPYTDESHLDPREFVGLGAVIGQTGGTWRVESIYPGTDADGKLVVGDVIEELDGMTLLGQNGAFVKSVIDAHPVGDPVTLGLDRAGTLTPVDVLVEDLLPSYPPR